VVNGAILFSHNVEVIKKIDETIEDILLFVFTNIRTNYQSNANEVIFPFYPGYKLDQFLITVPKKGVKKRLLELSEQNAKYFKLEQKKKISENKQYNVKLDLLKVLKSDLRLKKDPLHIECFDNSNIMGSNPVASCVVFKNLKPAKSEYRHYNIKTVSGINDFASMEEVVFRRYKRLMEEEKPLPDLVIIDGGKGQLNAAAKSLKKLGIQNDTTIVSIAKRLEEIFFLNDPIPLYIDKNSPSLKIIQNIRNEAHRFGITFHKLKRDKKMIGSVLDQIPGIGHMTKTKLIKEFKTIDGIKNTSSEKISQIIGEKKTKILLEYLRR